ncbi:DUF6391 domain-containing protein [Fuchsiella alkaliacetigena]|nr:DUF6391 domain-containing protein [Fuchsiella alkaliacetigena]
MYILLLILLLGFLFPPLLLPFFSLIFLIILFIPYKYTFDSIVTLLVAPKQIIKIAFNPDLRRNHALEHATINVIEELYGPQQLAGMAKEDGFYIMGRVNPVLVKEAAQEGLSRLQSGEKDLVIHNRCGTSLAVAKLVSSLTFLFLLFQTGNFTILYVVIAILASNLLGPIIGKQVQFLFTTSVDVKGMVISNVYYEKEAGGVLGWVAVRQPQKLFIKTDKLRTY